MTVPIPWPYPPRVQQGQWYEQHTYIIGENKATITRIFVPDDPDDPGEYKVWRAYCPPNGRGFWMPGIDDGA